MVGDGGILIGVEGPTGIVGGKGLMGPMAGEGGGLP